MREARKQLHKQPNCIDSDLALAPNASSQVESFSFHPIGLIKDLQSDCDESSGSECKLLSCNKHQKDQNPLLVPTRRDTPAINDRRTLSNAGLDARVKFYAGDSQSQESDGGSIEFSTVYLRSVPLYTSIWKSNSVDDENQQTVPLDETISTLGDCTSPRKLCQNSNSFCYSSKLGQIVKSLLSHVSLAQSKGDRLFSFERTDLISNEMKIFLFPFVLFLTSSLLIASQLQHSNVEKGQTGILPRSANAAGPIANSPQSLTEGISLFKSGPDDPLYGSCTKSPDSKSCSVSVWGGEKSSASAAGGEEWFQRENEAYRAFEWLHEQIDDDKDGELNARETGDFLAEELEAGSGAQQKHASFHSKHDSMISLQELWDNWQLTGIHNWTVEDVNEWLTNYVELPQYASIFAHLRVDGRDLPRLCVTSNNSLFQRLGILNKTHQRKIALKATDVVLFGIPKKNTLVKDAVLFAGLLVSMLSCWYLYWQYNYSQKQLKKVLKDLNSLQLAEDSLKQTQNELAEHKRQPAIIEQANKSSPDQISENCNSDRSEALNDVARITSDDFLVKLASKEEENSSLKAEVEKLEAIIRQQNLEKLSAVSNDGYELPPLLIEWLQITYEVESKHFLARKKIAEQQLEIAKQHGEKLTRKRNTFLGALQVAHGSGLSGIDNEILRARTALTEVTNDLHERASRWHVIESIIGKPITRNSGMKELRKYIANYESILKSVTSSVGGYVHHAGLSHVNTMATMSPPFSSAQSSSFSRSASQPNFSRNYSKASKSSALESTTDDVSSVDESESTTVNSIGPARLRLNQGYDLSQPMAFSQRQTIAKQMIPERSELEAGDASENDALSFSASSARLKTVPERNRADTLVASTNSSNATPVVGAKLSVSKSTVSFADEGGSSSETSSKANPTSCKLNGFASGDATEESVSLCSISAMSSISTDDVSSSKSSTQRQHPQMQRSATFDHNLETKKPKKSFLKRLISGGASHKHKSLNSSLTGQKDKQTPSSSTTIPSKQRNKSRSVENEALTSAKPDSAAK